MDQTCKFILFKASLWCIYLFRCSWPLSCFFWLLLSTILVNLMLPSMLIAPKQAHIMILSSLNYWNVLMFVRSALFASYIILRIFPKQANFFFNGPQKLSSFIDDNQCSLWQTPNMHQCFFFFFSGSLYGYLDISMETLPLQWDTEGRLMNKCVHQFKWGV